MLQAAVQRAVILACKRVSSITICRSGKVNLRVHVVVNLMQTAGWNARDERVTHLGRVGSVTQSDLRQMEIDIGERLAIRGIHARGADLAERTNPTENRLTIISSTVDHTRGLDISALCARWGNWVRLFPCTHVVYEAN